MLNLLKALRQDEHGVILSAEIVIIGSLLVIGLITGVTCLQQSVNGELKDVAGALGALDQSYAFSAHRKQGVGNQCCAWTAGASYVNCENGTKDHTEIVGCNDLCVNASNDCCHHCVDGAASVGNCGNCGNRNGGCGVCGGAGYSTGGFSVDGYQAPRKARCVESGVPKMKISEWPLDCPTEAIDHSMVLPYGVEESEHESIIVPQEHGVILSHPPVDVPQSHYQQIPTETPVNVDPIAPAETQPVPVTQSYTAPPVQPVPASEPLPMPPKGQ